MQKIFSFPKPLQAAVGEDLALLRDVAEGWLVEYKRGLIESSKLAKVLSSFANTNGGALFIGVEQSGGITSTERFPGIASKDVINVLQSITQAIQQGI